RRGRGPRLRRLARRPQGRAQAEPRLPAPVHPRTGAVAASEGRRGRRNIERFGRAVYRRGLRRVFQYYGRFRQLHFRIAVLGGGFSGLVATWLMEAAFGAETNIVL